LLIGLFLIPSRENTRPCDTHAETLESHLCQEGDIFLISVVKIHRHMARIIIAFDDMVINHPGNRGASSLVNIIDGKSFAAFQIAALELIRRRSSSPEKIRSQSLWHIFAPSRRYSGVCCFLCSEMVIPLQRN